MSRQPNIKLLVNFNNPTIDREESDKEAQKLWEQLRVMDGVEQVERVLDPNPPQGSKELGGFLVGLLSAEVSAANAKALFGFLSDRLGAKPIELEVEANGRKLKVKAHSREELETAIEAAHKFIAASN